MIQVLIVHDSPLIGNLLTAALQDAPDIRVVGYAASLRKAVKLCEGAPVDVALVGVHLPKRAALKLTAALTGDGRQVKVLVFGVSEQADQILPYIEAGAAGYILKTENFTNLVETIRLAQAGQALVSPEIASALMQRLAELARWVPGVGSEPIDLARLTPREREVIELLGENLSNQEIARRLFISLGTVKIHVHNILNKLGMQNRQQIAAFLSLSQEHPQAPD